MRRPVARRLGARTAMLWSSSAARRPLRRERPSLDATLSPSSGASLCLSGVRDMSQSSPDLLHWPKVRRQGTEEMLLRARVYSKVFSKWARTLSCSEPRLMDG